MMSLLTEFSSRVCAQFAEIHHFQQLMGWAPSGTSVAVRSHMRDSMRPVCFRPSLLPCFMFAVCLMLFVRRFGLVHGFLEFHSILHADHLVPHYISGCLKKD